MAQLVWCSERRVAPLMKPRICVCCGEPIVEKGNALSRNPNVCASCSSMVDGMDGTALADLAAAAPEEAPVPVPASEARRPVGQA